MEKLLEIARFELGNWMRALSVYVYFAIFFGLGFLIINMATGIPLGGIRMILPGLEYTNAPLTVMIVLTILGMLVLLVAAGIFSQAACKDFETRFANILFSFPLREWEYFIGRWFVAIIIVGFMLLAPVLGYLTGEWMPYLERDKLSYFNGMGYLYAYISVLLPNLVIFGNVFFSVGILTRQTLLVYLIGAALFIEGSIITNTLEHLPWVASLLDPTGLGAINATTKFWTSAQKASWLPIGNEILLNRLLWLALSTSLLACSLYQFRFSQQIIPIVRQKKSSVSKLESEIKDSPSFVVPLSLSYNYQYRLVFSQAWIEFQTLFSNRWFLLTLAISILPTLMVSSLKLLEAYGASQYPLTHLLLDKASDLFANLFKLLIIFLAGEIIWRDRTTRINPLIDTLPIRTFVYLLSKFIALALVSLSAILMILVSSVLVQTFAGYSRYEFNVYFIVLLTRLLPHLLLLSAMSLFLQVIIQNRYLGYFVTAVVLFGLPQLEALPQIPRIFVYGSFPEASYSQFDGYGNTLNPVRWFQGYWGIWAMLLLIVAVLFWQRGVDTGWKARFKVARQRFTYPVALVLLSCIGAILSLGSWIFYNTRILNQVITPEVAEKAKADYEIKYLHEGAAQPQITRMILNYDLYPQQRLLIAQGQYILENKTKLPVSKVQVYIRLINGVTVQKMVLGSQVQPKTERFPENLVQTFELLKPLPPGGKTTLDFVLEWQPRGFDERRQSTDILANGTNMSWHLPMVGYQTNATLTDPILRRKYNLKKGFSELTLLEQLKQFDSSKPPELITSDVTVSTSINQIAVVPGALQQQWIKGNRRYFSYQMSDPVINIPTLYSAQYQVKQDRWQDINLEIYYLKGHEYNIERILKSIKTSLSYFNTNFSPYQYKQVRVFELPRGRYAVALPATIGYSEFIGFLARIDERNPDSIDYSSLVAAHEIAHQWWGHQLVTYPDLKGTQLMNETLAQYSALMVMEKLYGKSTVRKILQHEQRMYLNGRSEAKIEEPLITTNAPHVYYRKGAIILYGLRDAIGENSLNHTLAKYLQECSKYSINVPPYPTVIDLLKYLHKATPVNKQYLIQEGFKDIILYDNRAKAATWKRRPDGQYDVTIAVNVQKLRSDAKGNEKSIALHPNEQIDIGILDATGNIIYCQKYNLHSGENTIVAVVGRQPKLAGIDPLNLLINRIADVNLIEAKPVLLKETP
ncbi:MAG: hypothetical protein KME29_20850 [Calothrix sp. FI2-JRJ7]|jgi:ABC-type transport system involved in multi-copper enzyme maturation permease subunit|nr:hypothetical protein [Calothrix sp. FI2-JRJ7]